MKFELVKPILLARRAVVYIRQSTTHQVVTNQGIVSDNRAEYMRNKTRGTPRDGELLLQGIAWCGRCGHKMYARYKGGAECVCNHLSSHQGLAADNTSAHLASTPR
jgi:hypothetical protein